MAIKILQLVMEANVPNLNGSNQVQMGNNSTTYAGIQVAWTITSDRRWKDNIRPLPYGLDMLMQLKPVDYTRKNDDKSKSEMGFIAQDLEQLFNKMGYTDQGILTKDDDGYLHLRYNDFIVLLTKGLQEQQVIIGNLKQKLSNQENAIEDLKAELGQLSSLVKQINTSGEDQILAEK